MDTNKLTAIIGALLIASGGIAGVRAWANASASATMHAPDADVQMIQTLPAITVRPTREQLQQLDQVHRAVPRGNALGATAQGGGIALDMPYYSFGMKSARASKG